MKPFLHTLTKYFFGAVLLLPGAIHAAPPPNDNFANAATLAFNTLTNVDVTDATFEQGEPPHASFGRRTLHSAWYHFTPPFSGQVELDTAGSGIDTVIAVYKGTAVNKLTLVEKGDDNQGGGTRARIRLAVSKGVKYYIACDAYSTGGAIQVIMQPLMEYQAGIFEAPLRFTSTTSGGSVEDNGKLSLTMTQKGGVSGKVVVGSKTYPFKSAILIDKTIPIALERADRLPLFITVTLETLASGKIRLAAEVQGRMGDKEVTSTAYQAPKFSKLNPCPRAGNYNYRVSSLTDAGHGICRLAVSSTGVCKGSGFLGDGTAFTYSVPLLNNDPDDVLLDLDGKGIFYHHTPLYGGKGQVMASVSLTRVNENDTRVTGSAGWFRPYGTGPFLPLGLESQNRIIAGKNYLPPSPNARLDTAFNPNNGAAVFQAESVGLTDIFQAVSLGTNNVFSVNGNNPNAVTLKLNVKTGLLTGSAKFDGQAKASIVRALLIPTGNGSITAGFYGFNLTPERAGIVSILPD